MCVGKKRGARLTFSSSSSLLLVMSTGGGNGIALAGLAAQLNQRLWERGARKSCTYMHTYTLDYC